MGGLLGNSGSSASCGPHQPEALPLPPLPSLVSGGTSPEEKMVCATTPLGAIALSVTGCDTMPVFASCACWPESVCTDTTGAEAVHATGSVTATGLLFASVKVAVDVPVDVSTATAPDTMAAGALPVPL